MYPGLYRASLPHSLLYNPRQRDGHTLQTGKNIIYISLKKTFLVPPPSIYGIFDLAYVFAELGNNWFLGKQMIFKGLWVLKGYEY